MAFAMGSGMRRIFCDGEINEKFFTKMLTLSGKVLEISFPFLRKVGCALISWAFPRLTKTGVCCNDFWVVKVVARFHRLA
jgi:hypothetical protein